MKILAFSDTHNKHNDTLFQLWITNALKENKIDVIVCAGDFSTSQKSFDNFVAWYALLPIPHKILIAGNHDEVLEHKQTRDNCLLYLKEENIHYLEDSAIIIDGVKFYGTPWTPIFMNWSFMKTNSQMISKFRKIDDDTNVLITHGPAYGILDLVKHDGNPVLHGGSVALVERLKHLKELKLHLFGHIHEEYGEIERYGVIHANVSTLNTKYEVKNKIKIFEI